MKKQYNVYVVKEMVNVQRAIIELYMHLGGLLRVALGYRFVRLLRFFRA